MCCAVLHYAVDRLGRMVQCMIELGVMKGWYVWENVNASYDCMSHIQPSVYPPATPYVYDSVPDGQCKNFRWTCVLFQAVC